MIAKYFFQIPIIFCTLLALCAPDLSFALEKKTKSSESEASAESTEDTDAVAADSSAEFPNLALKKTYKQEIVTVKTRNDVTQSFILTLPENPPKAIALLYNGGQGSLNLEKELLRKDMNKGNFLIRARFFLVDEGIATASVRPPSDLGAEVTTGYRYGDNNAEDALGIGKELKKRFPGVPIFVIGTSRGTQSAANIGRKTGDFFTGIILTSSTFRGNQKYNGISGYPFDEFKTSILFVHHQDDQCPVCPYIDAKEKSEKYPLITVKGGGKPRSSACEALHHHGFVGIEGPTMNAIANYMLKKDYPKVVGE